MTQLQPIWQVKSTCYDHSYLLNDKDLNQLPINCVLVSSVMVFRTIKTNLSSYQDIDLLPDDKIQTSYRQNLLTWCVSICKSFHYLPIVTANSGLGHLQHLSQLSPNSLNGLQLLFVINLSGAELKNEIYYRFYPALTDEETETQWLYSQQSS